jgi:predicted metal-binding protein
VTVVDQTNVAELFDAVTIYVCITCGHSGEPEGEPRPGAILAAATAKAAEGTGVTVRPVRCLGR